MTEATPAAQVPTAALADYQNEIYAQGLGGVVPEFPTSYAELEAKARTTMTPEAYGYVAGGAGSEDTMRANLEAFRRWRIEPRMLRDVATRSLRRVVLGTELPAPVLLAPVGVQGIVHADAEIAVARAARSLGVPMVLSTASSRTIEDVADALGETPRWLQLYWSRDPEFAASLLSRAEHAGYSAVVVTLDTRILGWRPRDLGMGYMPFLRGLGTANYFSDPVFRSRLSATPEEELLPAVLHWSSIFSDPSQTWKDLAFLRQHTRLPLVLKGILSADDAERAVAAGVEGIVVSNHGGRQVDGCVAALDALPRVVAAVPSGFPVLFDSGVRTGADIVKALALGAQAVLVGRPYVYGLAVGGEAGVHHVLRGLLAELDITLALAGHASVDDLSPDCLVREPA
jgi:L-lactate dehydrogenase (cytochrome)